MQTRKKAKLAEASAGFQNLLENLHDGIENRSSEVKEPKSDILADASRKDVDKLLKRVGAQRVSGRKRQESSPAEAGSHGLRRKTHKSASDGENALFYQRQSPEASISEIHFQILPIRGMEASMSLDAESRRKDKDENHELLGTEFLESMDDDAMKLTSGEGDQEPHDGYSEKNMDEVEVDWEDGHVAPREGSAYGHPNLWNGELTIELGDDSVKLDKKQSIRRATAKDKEFAELVHKAHLLCLIGRGRLVDTACNDPLIQVLCRLRGGIANFFSMVTRREVRFFPSLPMI